MTEVGTGEALDLDELRELVKLARHRLTVHPSDGWAADFADNVPALVAEVERLRAQRDEALRELDGAPLNLQSALLAAVLRASRVLSRTEDGTNER